ncbi:kinase-like protein [Mycena crocata]|nr:kinase-like protein [Mycena crocata]
MHHRDRIKAVFESSPTRSSSSPRSPLSPILPPNEVKPLRKSIRQVALENRHKLASQSNSSGVPPSPSSMRRRSVKLWGRQLDRMSAGEAAPAVIDRPVQFKWVRGQAIGRGAHGRVYLGLNARTGEMIAVKQISFPRKESPGRPSAELLKREMENMKVLRHPNLAEYLALEEDGESVSLFMEYIQGRSIRANVLKHGSFGEDVAKSFTSQILDGLIYLHARGIFHGELKSTNILVDPTGTCKIEGLCCSNTAPHDNSRAVPRAIFWTAPEVIRTQYKAYDSMADIWSLGCVVLEMCTGKLPWIDAEAVAVMFKLYHQTARPHPPEDSNLDLLAEDFMEKCLALQPHERVAAVELKQHSYLELSPGWVFNGVHATA